MTNEAFVYGISGRAGGGRRPWGPRWAGFVRAAFVFAPLCVLVYGVVRLADPGHGPGPAWTVGHVFLAAGLVLFGAVFLGLRRLAVPAGRAGRAGAGVATGLGLAGAVAAVAQAGIDLVVGFQATDRAGMDRLFEEVQGRPGVEPVVYSVGPMLFYVGLLWLVTQLAVQRRTGVWRPVAVLLGTAVMAVSLDLIPLGALLFAAALSPLGRDLAAHECAARADLAYAGAAAPRTAGLRAVA
ncbi:hypothetical protein BX286_4230 [Streptomyces sp. 3211.6]|uniref:hypothetical protein n=1 Tax=Streptomyces sp. 3211.6 TaxID=1938845 RepID=UPI000F16D098|nr:hypothetical protein [Streptomyces sp. 3211.6]RKT06192.1 hypothetical protein BX286_4230 [Streptomyces sp. 3211.6]